MLGLPCHREVSTGFGNHGTLNKSGVAGTLKPLKAMRKCGVEKLILSSSVSVYGDPETIPIPGEPF